MISKPTNLPITYFSAMIGLQTYFMILNEHLKELLNLVLESCPKEKNY